MICKVQNVDKRVETDKSYDLPLNPLNLLHHIFQVVVFVGINISVIVLFFLYYLY